MKTASDSIFLKVIDAFKKMLPVTESADETREEYTNLKTWVIVFCNNDYDSYRLP